MVELERRVRFEEVDAAGIVFFGAFSGYVHEAMEHFFDQVKGGYPGLINDRRIGFPAVRLEIDFASPVRYGDTMVIATSVARLGTRSATLRYRIRRGETECAEVRHTVVITDLDRMKSTDMPLDVRAALEAHLES